MGIQSELQFHVEEVWKDAVGFEGHYKVSSKGRVESLTRTLIRTNLRPIPIKGRILKVHIPRRTGYACVLIMGKWQRVHRLVAKAFINNPKNKPFVNHLNGIRTDNRVENLEWTTPSENCKHAYRVLKTMKLKPQKGGKHKKARKVLATFDNGETKVYEAIQVAARDLDLSAGNICTTLKGERNHTRGIDFKYL